MKISRPYPFEDFGGNGSLIVFCHANGYPPAAYRTLFADLAQDHHIIAMRMRPLWPGSNPADLLDWRLLSDDLEAFLDQHGLSQVIGVGHSMGATTTMRFALDQPSRFEALILIDPVLFPPFFSHFWKLIYLLGMADYVHPPARQARRRRSCFENRSEMYSNFRSKNVFKRLSDNDLMSYVDALACQSPDGHIKLCYPAEWEARIYVTGGLADLEIWNRLATLKPPLLLIRGQESQIFWEKSEAMFRQRLPDARIVDIPDAGHLVPLERPAKVAQVMRDFLNLRSSIGRE